MMSYLVIDLETGSKTKYGRVGNPWVNPIVAVGLKDDSHNPAKSRWILGDSEESINRNLNYIFENKTLLIGHNIKFDLLHLWKFSAVQNYFARGGKIWDTQLSEYILTGQRTKYAKLRTIAVEKYGCAERPKHIDEYLEKGVDIPDIPKELVLADVTSDVLDTEQIYLIQRQAAIISGVNTLIEFQMDALLATTEMEYNGMRINQDVLKKNKEELEIELEQTKQELEQLIKPYWR